MPTAFPEIFAALCRPFDPGQVKTRSQGGRQLSYITARTAMNRFDAVLGPEAWRDTYTDTPDGLRCRIEIRVGGEWLWKEDGGAGANMPEADNEEKSAYSDAFKRAAVKWGVARYLYQDGVPSYESNGQSHAPAAPTADIVRTPAPTPEPRPVRPAPSVNGMPPAFDPAITGIRKPSSGKGLFACTREQEKNHEASFLKPLNDWAKKSGMADRMVDWAEDDLENGWRYLCYLVAKHTGALNGSAPAPATNGTGNGDVSGLRKEIVAKAAELLHQVNGTVPVDAEIGNKLRGLWSELFQGADMGKFGAIADTARLAALKETLDMEFKELATDSIPF